MKIGLLTSWQTQCGIAEYSSHLARGLQDAGAEVVILGSRNYGARALPPDPLNDGRIAAIPVFDVGLWNDERREDLDVETILGLGFDVLHVQYEAVLFNRRRLQQLLDGFRGVKAITWHDSCIPPDMPGPWDAQFTHRQGVGSGHVIPFGVDNLAPLVRTFGLGRTREDVIAPICERHGFTFQSAATSEAALGGQSWLSQADLHFWLRAADAIVLWYGDEPAAGSSQAARTALATRRPVFVNDVTWFRDLPEQAGALRKLPDSPAELEHALVEQLATPYITECSWEHVAALHLRDYGRVLDPTLVAPDYS